jgi:hypothetical protein
MYTIALFVQSAIARPNSKTSSKIAECSRSDRTSHRKCDRLTQLKNELADSTTGALLHIDAPVMPSS